jgi:hypothetical protein
MSRTLKLLDSLSSRGSSSHVPNESVETAAADDETIAETVRKAVAEHERAYHDADDDATADDDRDEAAGSSASGRSPVGLLGVAAVLALLGYLARKRRRGPDEDHDTDDDHDATDADESTDVDDG